MQVEVLEARERGAVERQLHDTLHGLIRDVVVKGCQVQRLWCSVIGLVIGRFWIYLAEKVCATRERVILTSYVVAKFEVTVFKLELKTREWGTSNFLWGSRVWKFMQNWTVLNLSTRERGVVKRYEFAEFEVFGIEFLDFL